MWIFPILLRFNAILGKWLYVDHVREGNLVLDFVINLQCSCDTDGRSRRVVLPVRIRTPFTLLQFPFIR